MFIDDIDIKYVNFFQVPPSYFQSIKLLRTGRDMDLYENILQVVVRNQSVIFNLDENDRGKPLEINFIDDFEQLMDPDTLVNTGIVHSTSERLML